MAAFEETSGLFSAKAPVFIQIVACRESTLPSEPIAVRIVIRASSARVVRIDSSIVSSRRTGRFAFQEQTAVRGSILVYDLEPKPPPISGEMIRTRLSGS